MKAASRAWNRRRQKSIRTGRRPGAAPTANTRKPRELKVYKNPNNGEVSETKGGNHKALKEWKANTALTSSTDGKRINNRLT
ncbi:hypothetical protein [Pseudomonas sp. SM4]|uniref:hypothetical protein n=1 Tax=Pseudomonas sp. SM4 TaxID=3424177 RepID=UPI003F7A5E54